MRAVFLRKAGELFLDDIPEPSCGEHEVLIRVREAGVCGSDLHYFNDGRIGDHVVIEPHILGHEASGEVVEAGRSVEDLVAGDRVAIEPGVPCMACPQCRGGRYNLCASVRFSGAPPYPGMFRELVSHDARFAVRLPDSVSFVQGALAEPLAVAHNAVTKARLSAGETALVIGAGPIGFSCVEMAAAAGASRIIVSEPLAFRRRAALSLGAGWAVDPFSENLLERVADLTGGRLCDCVFEASGADSAVAEAVRCAGRGGRVVFVGMGKPMAAVPHGEILKKEAEVYGIYRYVNDFGPVVALLAAGKLKGEPWVSHRFSLETIQDAIRTANDPHAEKLKVMVHAGDGK
jgi:L-iditol 2-dehydrogenase